MGHFVACSYGVCNLVCNLVIMLKPLGTFGDNAANPAIFFVYSFCTLQGFFC